MNQVNLIGRLTKNIEIKMTPSQKKVAQFTLAVYRTKEDTDFISCVAWEKTAELLEMYTFKGSQVGITGSIRTRSYDDPYVANRKVYVTEVLVSSIYLLDSKKKEEQYRPANTYESYEPVVTSDDLPF
jgi:single-strand DNA-binding protein